MAVVKIEVSSRRPYASGATFANTGEYERIEGKLTFAVDPLAEVNSAVVDLTLAPRDADGRVRFQSDFSLVTPASSSRGNRRLILDIPNRGNAITVPQFNRVARRGLSATEDPVGDGFLFRQGYSILSVAWQWDVMPSPGVLVFDPPYAEIDGRPVRGQAMVEYRPIKPGRSTVLCNRVHRPYRAADVNEADARLIVRDYEDDDDTVIPRDQWRFAEETEAGLVPSDGHFFLETGFVPGKIYTVVYTTEGAPVVGAGMLAMRDAAIFFRRPSTTNPAGAGFDYVYTFGSSQTGRLQRDMILAGLNIDETGAIAFDGMLPQIAGGRRGDFNSRFAQPSAQAPTSFGHLPPFTDNPVLDPYTGKTAGLLDRLRMRNAVPKIIYTNSSAEYWRCDGSLAHMDPTGTRDVPLPEEVRSYFFAGTQHGGGSLPLSRAMGEGGAAQNYANILDYSPLQRAALVNLDRWVSQGIKPPASKYPRLDDGTAITRESALDAQVVPGVRKPDASRLWRLRVTDLGPDADRGIGRFPAQEGAEYATRVSAVDADGNEVAGIRLPDIAEPVATYIPWNLRAPEMGAPEQIVQFLGSTFFFAATRQQREAAGDPRPSIEERYADRNDYVARVRAVARQLAADRYVLEDDVELLVDLAASRYDAALQEAGERVAVAAS